MIVVIPAPQAGAIECGVPLVEVVVPEGLDTSAGPRLASLLDEALALRPAELVIDFGGCPHIDAATIDVLLDVHRRIRRGGGRLTLRSPSSRLRRNLELARADRVLNVTPRDPDAVVTS